MQANSTQTLNIPGCASRHAALILTPVNKPRSAIYGPLAICNAGRVRFNNEIEDNWLDEQAEGKEEVLGSRQRMACFGRPCASCVTGETCVI